MPALPAGTVTSIITDIEGSAALLKQLGERYGDVLAQHRRIVRKTLERRAEARSTPRAKRSSSAREDIAARAGSFEERICAQVEASLRASGIPPDEHD
jgi:class 3 adenylate cyclase